MPRNVLIVDDDVEMLKILKTYLQDDYQVTIVDSGKQALEYVVKHTPDLILLDYIMPLFDGPHVLDILRKRQETKNVPVLFLTAVKDKDRVLECLQYNPQGYLIKPVTRDELLNRVDEIFRKM